MCGPVIQNKELNLYSQKFCLQLAFDFNVHLNDSPLLNTCYSNLIEEVCKKVANSQDQLTFHEVVKDFYKDRLGSNHKDPLVQV